MYNILTVLLSGHG